MNLFNQEEIVELQTELKNRFAEFSKINPVLKGRRCPKELKELVFQARGKGLRAAAICKLTGLSSSAVHRYAKSRKPISIRPRRLTIVGAKPEKKLTAPIIVRLSSGVAIELISEQELSLDLLKRLAALGSAEVDDVASR
jgi:predicted transcriptional regulator